MRKRDLAQAGQQWLNYKRDVQRLAHGSVMTYRSSLRSAFKDLPEEFDPEDLQAQFTARMGAGVSATTAYSSYVALELFFRWWQENGGPKNPLAQAKRPAKPTARRRALTDRERSVLALRLKNADGKVKAMLLLMLTEGFRPVDVVSLQVEHVDWSGQQIRCVRSKGGKDDIIPLLPGMAGVLRQYLGEYGITAGFVFTGRKGKMSTRAVNKSWARVTAGELRGVVPYQLRHSYAMDLLKSQTDIHTLKDLMRHKDLRSTQLYLDSDMSMQRAAMARAATLHADFMDLAG